MTIHYDVERELGSGVTYTEELGRAQLSLAVRDCSLRQAGVDAPISSLNLLSFRQRFGAVAVPAEGIGGVETLPAFRRQGHIRTLLHNVIAGSASRVSVLFVSDGIEELYEKFGFVNCVAEACLSIPVRNVEQLAESKGGSPSNSLRGFSQADLPAMVALYNDLHAQRPWTHERHAGWDRLVPTRTWKPGSEVLVVERADRLVGYAIMKESQYGHGGSTFRVDELGARDVAAALALLGELAARCWRLRLSTFTLHEPLDSIVGVAAQRLGCEYHQTFLPRGGMLGKILHRQQLLLALEPELQRRLPSSELRALHTSAFDALCRGEILNDDTVLLRLLVGHCSLVDACAAYGTTIPAQYAPVAQAWFPGGGTHLLAQPYAHLLDRY